MRLEFHLHNFPLRLSNVGSFDLKTICQMQYIRLSTMDIILSILVFYFKIQTFGRLNT